jgi:hypothetical protein
MIRANEIRRGSEQIQFTLNALNGASLQPRRRRNAYPKVAERAAVSPYQLNISGSQLLVWFSVGFCALSLFTWALLRLWLFEQ